MANSVSGIKARMLAEIGAERIEELFEQIPADHRRKAPLDLPPTLASETELRRHLLTTLCKNEDCERYLSFLGAGCWQHHVPAVVDEIVGRTEFLTPVWGSPQSDHGRNQAWFEFNSQLGELLEMEVVQLPVYSWGCAIGHAIRMACRITGRRRVLVPRLFDPERLSVLRTYCEPAEMAGHIEVVPIEHDPATGRLDLRDLAAKLGPDVAAVYFESPSYLGIIETGGATIARLARAVGAETIVGADPISLGVLRPPADYGADIVVGPTQPLGVHMNCGGGVGGYMASRDEEKYVREFNGFLVSIAETREAGQLGFGLSCAHQTSYGMRDEGKDWTGNSVYLWAIANAVYMALLGPEGFQEVGELILARARYAAWRLASIDGVRIVWPDGFFKEFVVDFDGTGQSVAAINQALHRRHRIFGGKDLSAELPEFGQSALYCVTEIHTRHDIERLAGAIEEVVGR
ncbi:MAG: aminomethyl-transferring glycine dehydrogenase subunit GcvPA [Geminicoccaceae bacterium]